VCQLPEGTIYAFPDCSAYRIPSSELAEELLHEVHVATEEGTYYGSSGEGHLRFVLGLNLCRDCRKLPTESSLTSQRNSEPIRAEGAVR